MAIIGDPAFGVVDCGRGAGAGDDLAFAQASSLAA